jgi:hypothetical protein
VGKEAKLTCCGWVYLIQIRPQPAGRKYVFVASSSLREHSHREVEILAIPKGASIRRVTTPSFGHSV